MSLFGIPNQMLTMITMQNPDWLYTTNASVLYISICQLIDLTERNFSRDLVKEIGAEKIHSGSDGGFRAQRQAPLSSSKLIQEFSQEIIEFKENHQVARLDQIISGKDVNDFLHLVTLCKEISTIFLEDRLKLESLVIKWLAEGNP
ncbi:hypothetical protein PSHT_14645 [Puccinia striiformis]|uniref:Uncharacterized protein n=1 Tax=Puccinia striiformis TaxID=27350 RepID=A0A2S4UJN2_9BASI|nr:hypothetical protein PSHT_14645 [Puccinia striiformis]